MGAAYLKKWSAWPPNKAAEFCGLVTCFAPRRYGRLVENQRSWRRPLWDGATNEISSLHLPFGISVAYQFF
jgi:hypothetical protein